MGAIHGLTQKKALLREMGDSAVILSSANTFSYAKRTMVLKNYITQLQSQSVEGSAKVYL